MGVTRMSCGVLWKLALNAENVRRIQELGGDDLAQEALEKHLTDDEVHRLATEALGAALAASTHCVALQNDCLLTMGQHSSTRTRFLTSRTSFCCQVLSLPDGNFRWRCSIPFFLFTSRLVYRHECSSDYGGNS